MNGTQNPGRIAVVTGASSGIGAATARALAADGHRVALLARRTDRISGLARELDNGSIAIEADVTDRSALVAAAERVKQELGDADVLVNNAGVMLLGPFGSDQRDDYRQMIEVNLLGAITPLPGRAVRPATEETFTMYAATKWGINGWSESLRATELPNHITHAETKQGAEALYSQVDVTAKDIAEVIAFAVSRPRRLAIHEILLRPAGQDA